MKLLATVLIAAGLSSLTSIAAPARAASAEFKSQITILYAYIRSQSFDD